MNIDLLRSKLKERFCRYAQIWTTSNSSFADKGTIPSTECQFELAKLLVEELKNIGLYSEEQQKKILTSWILGYIKPGANFNNAHTTRNIMQHNYLIKNNAIFFDSLGKIKINFMRVTECAKEMLNKAIRIQLDGDPQKAKEYIDKHAVFTKELQILANKLNGVSKKLNSYVAQPLADILLQKL